VDIGKRLRELREAKGLSQGEVEARTGVPRDEISNIENGQGTPTLPVLEKWANALGVELHQFFAIEQEKSPTSAQPEGIPAQERTLLQLLRQMPAEDRVMLISLARDMVKRKGKHG
jgi:transcriptional regulator with XRE-family HTH domain